MICPLRLALLFCCGSMLLLIFIFTWHPLKDKIPGEQVSRSLLSWDCEKLFQFIPKEKLLLSTGIAWRVLEKSCLDCSGDGDDLIFLSNNGGGGVRFRNCWWHYKHFIFITRVICIKTRSELWPVMFFISHFENTKDFNFRTVVFLEDWFVCFFIFAQFCKW